VYADRCEIFNRIVIETVEKTSGGIPLEEPLSAQDCEDEEEKTESDKKCD
jgi:hypothetical protein